MNGFQFAIIVVAAFLLGATITGFGIYEVNRITCHHIAEQMMLPWQFNLWTGCMVRVRDHWTTLESLRVQP